MGLFRRCKEQWALVKEMRTMFKAEWERAKRWHSITQAEAESLGDEELWDCITSRLPQVEEPEELAALAGPVRVVYTLYWYDLEVQNGGLCQLQPYDCPLSARSPHGGGCRGLPAGF